MSHLPGKVLNNEEKTESNIHQQTQTKKQINIYQDSDNDKYSDSSSGRCSYVSDQPGSRHKQDEALEIVRKYLEAKSKYNKYRERFHIYRALLKNMEIRAPNAEMEKFVCVLYFIFFSFFLFVNKYKTDNKFFFSLFLFV